MPYNRWKEASSRPPTYPSYETFYIDANQEFQSESEKSEVTHNVIVKPTLDAVSHWGMLDHLFGLRPMYSHDHVRDPITTDEDHGEAKLRLFFSVDQPNNKRPGVSIIT
ncbi:hypothetical protein GQ600_11909 [Phytophthora cactorum]|nr:hypothetical protein GQ600_11909 [Phytophthora cactorum]